MLGWVEWGRKALLIRPFDLRRWNLRKECSRLLLVGFLWRAIIASSYPFLLKTTSPNLISNLSSESPRGPVKTAFLWQPHPQFLIQQAWSGVWKFAFPPSTQVVLMLLLWDNTWRTTDLHHLWHIRWPEIKQKGLLRARNIALYPTEVWILCRPSSQLTSTH